MKLCVATWTTNYGELVALIWASSIGEAKTLAIEAGAWTVIA